MMLAVASRIVLISSVVAGSLGFDSRAGQIRRSVASDSSVVTTARFLRGCVAQALSRGDGPRRSLLASSE